MEDVLDVLVWVLRLVFAQGRGCHAAIGGTDQRRLEPGRADVDAKQVSGHGGTLPGTGMGGNRFVRWSGSCYNSALL